MDVCPDYEDLFKALNACGVKYLVIGGQAVIFHSQPRFTKDIDVWLPPELNDGQDIYAALRKFGAPLKGLSPKDFANRKLILQIGVAPVRIDLIVDVLGVDYAKAWKGRVKSRYGKTPMHFVGLKELLKSKRTAGRKQDLLDVSKLLKTHQKKKAKRKK